jgi:hypothetical protein
MEEKKETSLGLLELPSKASSPLKLSKHDIQVKIGIKPYLLAI